MTKPLVSLALALTAAGASWAMLCPSSAALAGVVQAGERSAYVLFGQGNSSSVMNGSDVDLARARAARRGGEAMLYIRQGGAAYVVRDSETLRQAQAIFAPQTALGARQAELGGRQAALGSRQAALGAQQARLGLRQASVAPREAGDLGEQQAALGRQQDELGRQQDALGRQQAQLGEEQERLGRAAQGQFRALATDAIRRGVAQRVD